MDGGSGEENRSQQRKQQRQAVTGQVARRVYNWTLWGFVVLLQLSQVLGGLEATQKQSEQRSIFGKSPLEGLYEIPGTNDEPFTDRTIVCSRKGRLYKPQQLSSALSSASGSSNSSAAKGKNGYRVLHRTGLVLSPDVRDYYANTCSQIAAMLTNIQQICRTLGYEISPATQQQHEQPLRVVVNEGDGDAATVVTLPSTLPILIFPYWDNAVASRFVIPGEDGSACVFRLVGRFNNAASSVAGVRAVNRTVKEVKTIEWLGLEGGTWRHGWYEHASPPSRWYSDVISTDRGNPYGIFNRYFDATSGQEIDCLAPSATIEEDACVNPPVTLWWGKDLAVEQHTHWYHSVTVTNGKRLGLFLYEETVVRYIVSMYRLETLLSNVSMSYLLFRWLVALVALRHTDTAISVGVLACVRSFHLLPLMLLPRLKSILAVFCSVGCQFEGDQKSLGEAFFVMYPAIAEFGVLLYSLLNLLAKLLRRRMSDVLFGPMLMVLCVVHYLRFDIAQSGWMGINGRVTPVVTAAEFESARLMDFVTTKLAFRMNGEILSLFGFKLALLALQLVPLVWFTGSTSTRNYHNQRTSQAEKAMAIRVACNGGLGKSQIHQCRGGAPSACSSARKQSSRSPATVVAMDGSSSQQRTATGTRATSKRRSTQQKLKQPAQLPTVAVVPYEVVRAGFVVLGRDALVSIHDWCAFLISAPLRACHVPMHHIRVMVWTLTQRKETQKSTEVHGTHGSTAAVGQNAIGYDVSERPLMYRVTDDRFQHTCAWQIASYPLR